MRLSKLPVAAVLVAGAVVLAGCTATSESGETDSLRVVMQGSDNETLDYGAAQSYFPWVVVHNICDSLVTRVGGETNLVLAEAIEPNADATQWTITLREGPTFHDGSPVTAEDVVASLRYFAESPGFAGLFGPMDADGMAAMDEKTLRVPLIEPRWDFVETILSAASVVYQGGEGASDDPPCGGPFSLESYSSETGAVLTRFGDYWGTPATLERIEVRRVNDPTARVNALVSGESDFAYDIPASTAATVTDGSDLQLLQSDAPDSGAFYFALNARIAPFDDPEVRRALKLAVDREQLVEVAFGGYGEIGNDLFGMGLPDYADGLEQRERDLDEAGRILETAGVTELSLTVAAASPGLTESADVLKQQLAEIGVTLTVDEIDASAWFTDLEGLHQSQIITWYAANQHPLAGIDTWLGAENPFNYTGWGPDQFAHLVAVARSGTDEAERADAVQQLQRLQWDDGGYVIWGYRGQLSGAVGDLDGVVLNQGTPLFGAAARG